MESLGSGGSGSSGRKGGGSVGMAVGVLDLKRICERCAGLIRVSSGPWRWRCDVELGGCVDLAEARHTALNCRIRRVGCCSVCFHGL